MPDAEEKDRARGRIKAAAKKYDIEVDDDSLKGMAAKADATNDDEYADVGNPDDDTNGGDMPEDCACNCAECVDGDCKGCSCSSCACDGCACDTADKARKSKAALAKMRLQLDLAGAA